MITISSGNYDVLQSGTIIPFLHAPVEFKIEGKTEVIRLQLDVKLADSPPEKTLEAQLIEKNVLRLTLVNVKRSLLSGTNAPITLGTLDNRILLLHIRTFNFDEKDPIIHYTFFLGGEVTKHG